MLPNRPPPSPAVAEYAEGAEAEKGEGGGFWDRSRLLDILNIEGPRIENQIGQLAHWPARDLRRVNNVAPRMPAPNRTKELGSGVTVRRAI